MNGIRLVLLATLSIADLCAQPPAAEVSYFRDIRPIMQRTCQGCHQPAM